MIAPHEQLERALDTSTSDECLIILEHSHSANIRWANNTLTTNGEMRDIEATAIAFQGAGYASVTGPAASVDDLVSLVARADADASQAAPAEDRADLAADRDNDSFIESPEATSIGVFADFISGLGTAFGEADQSARTIYGFAHHEMVTSYLASTTGLRLRHVQPTGHYGCTAKDSTLTNSAWVGAATRDFADVDADAMAAELATRIGWGQRRIDLPAGRYPTLLPPAAVADLLIDAYMYGAGARTAHEGQSAFSKPGGGTRIGEQLASHGVHLYSDPHSPGIAAAPFVMTAASDTEMSVYDNGLELTRNDWISDGTLTSLIQSRHSATITGQPLTPHIDNLTLEIGSGAGTLDDLVAATDDGLLLTCLWYIREVDPQTMLLTGLTRDGVYQVRSGEIVGMVNNFRFNESPLSLLRRFDAATETGPAFSREWGDEFSRTAMPALRIPDFNMSSVSPAV